MTASYRALHLGDRRSPADPPCEHLARGSDLLTIEHEPDLAAGLAEIEAGAVACVLVDEGLVGPDEAGVVDRVTALDPALPVILVSDEDAATATAADAGVTDVVTLPDDGPPATTHVTRIENAAVRYRATDGDDRIGGTPHPTGITEQIAHEEYERLFGDLGQSVFVADEHGEYTYVNPSGAQITGYDPEEIVAGGPELLFPDEAERETFTAAVRRLLADDGPATVTAEATLKTKSGETCPIEATITPRMDDEGRFQGVVGVVRDVTEQRKTERRLRENRTIMRAIPDEIVVLDKEGFLTRVIPSVDADVTASGYTPEELDGMHVSKVMDEESFEQAADLLAEMIEGDQDRATIEMQIVTRDGDRLWRESHFTLLEDDDGTILGSIGILRDIEERLAYEAELERQNDRLEQFASITSHDLRNPLNLAQGYVDLAAEECDTDHLDTVDGALDRMARLIDDTLTWARQGTEIEERRPVALEPLVAECWEAVGTDAGGVEVREDLTVRGDPDRMRRLFENLLRNAVEHGGRDVTVEIGAIREGATARGDGGGDDGGDDGGDGGGDDGAKPERWTGFYVADDGPGIPPDQREDVLEAGFTTAQDGTGFGLAIIGEICEAHGWDVAVTDSEAGGARFEITGVDAER